MYTLLWSRRISGVAVSHCIQMSGPAEAASGERPHLPSPVRFTLGIKHTHTHSPCEVLHSKREIDFLTKKSYF